MAQEGPSGDAAESISTVTGGSKPVHRFLRGEPKCIGIVLMLMGTCLFMFGITMKTNEMTSANMYTPFWIGVLFIICGLLYILSERNPTKKIITASFALSIVSIIGMISASTDFIGAFADIQHRHMFHEIDDNYTEEENHYMEQHYMSISNMELVFLAHSLIGGVLITTVMFFARAALRSSGTQAVVVMRNLPSVVE